MNSGTPVPGHFAVRLVATTLNIGVTFLTGADAGARSFAQRGRSGPRTGGQSTVQTIPSSRFDGEQWRTTAQ
jgi:hypothetical protein